MERLHQPCLVQEMDPAAATSLVFTVLHGHPYLEPDTDWVGFLEL